MKRTFKRIFALALTVLMLSATASSALATEQPTTWASAYLTYYGVSLSANGSTLHIEYDMLATGVMDELGVYQIAIKQLDSSGSWSVYKTLYGSTYPNFVAYDTYGHAGELDYVVPSGNTYKVTVSFYATEYGTGSDGRSLDSVTVYT